MLYFVYYSYYLLILLIPSPYISRAARRRRLLRVRGGAEMVQIDARTLQTLIGALQGQQQQQRQQERVKMLLYDGKSDPEGLLSIMRHLTQTYRWTRAERLAKLKTALTGRAVKCSRPNDYAEIKRLLRSRFGITVPKAKRQLMAMKKGRSEEFAEIANEIRRLAATDYPTLTRSI